MIEGIKYIGADDIDLQKFENQYPITKGISYNSYLIEGEKTAITDTVDKRCTREWLAHLNDALAGRTPDYLIVHHMEPDHSANISMLMDKYPDLKLVASARAIGMLPQFFDGKHWEGRTIAVNDGDSLDLGNGCTVEFLMAPMIHWPEVMMCYLPKQKAVMSADAFGSFGALQYQTSDWESEARRYYINIVGKYGAQVQTVLRKMKSLDIKAILPLHGRVIDSNIDHYLGLYDKWSSYTPETKGTLIAYASVYGGTAFCAERLADILRSKPEQGETVLFDLSNGDMSEAVSQAFRLSSMVLASVTYDGGIFPPMEEFLSRLRHKTYRNRRVGLIENGSWAPVAGRLMAKELEGMRDIEIITPTVTIKSRMTESDEKALKMLADSIAGE